MRVVLCVQTDALTLLTSNRGILSKIIVLYCVCEGFSGQLIVFADPSSLPARVCMYLPCVCVRVGSFNLIDNDSLVTLLEDVLVAEAKAGELTGIFPQIDRIFHTATLKKHLRGLSLGFRAEV